MALHIRPVSELVYIYDGPDGYEVRSRFKAIATLLYLSEHTVEIIGLHGEITREAHDEIREALHKRGVSNVLADRHGKFKNYEV